MTARELTQIIADTLREREDPRDIASDERVIGNFVRMFRTDDTTAIVKELVEAFNGKAEELGFYIKNRSEVLHRDLDDGDVVLLGFRLVRKLPLE